MVAQGFSRFAKVTRRDEQHPEALAVFFAQVFVVNLVGLPNRHKVGVFGSFEPWETLVDEDVVDQEVCQAIERDAGSNPEPEILVDAACDEAVGTRHGENQKEGIVLLEKARSFRRVVFRASWVVALRQEKRPLRGLL